MSECAGERIRSASNMGSLPHHTSQRHILVASGTYFSPPAPDCSRYIQRFTDCRAPSRQSRKHLSLPLRWGCFKPCVGT